MPDGLFLAFSDLGSVPEDEFHDWYDNEHLPTRLTVPGWRRARRYRQVSGDGPEYLSFHDVDGPHVFDNDEYKAATTTPWRNRIVKTALARERRVFTLHKAFR